MTVDKDRPPIKVGTEIPPRERTPDAVDLFTFSASAWLLHRIHYDVAFTTESDGHPGLLVHGPLQGTYMIQAVQWWLGPDVELKSIAYRHSSPAYLGDVLTCGGSITEVDAEAATFQADLWVSKRRDVTERRGESKGGSHDAADADSEQIVTTSGVATFSLTRS